MGAVRAARRALAAERARLLGDGKEGVDDE